MQHFQEVRYGNIRKCLWLTLENPGYSIPSKLFSLLSIGVVLTSIATMCINSIPEYQVGTKSWEDQEAKQQHCIQYMYLLYSGLWAYGAHGGS